MTVRTSEPRWSEGDAVWKREGHHAIALSSCHAVLVARCRAATSGEMFDHLRVHAAANLTAWSTPRPYPRCIICSPPAPPPATKPPRFDIQARFYHDLAATTGSALNVFSGGRALDLNTHHAGGPLANLFTDIHAGLGNRLFASPGAGAAGPRATFYNLRVAAPEPPQVPPQNQSVAGAAGSWAGSVRSGCARPLPIPLCLCMRISLQRCWWC